MLVSRVSAKVQKQRQSNVVERCLSMSPPEVVWYCWPEKFDETYVSTSDSYSASDSQVVQVADSLREWKTMIHLCSMRAMIQTKKTPTMSPRSRFQDSFNLTFFWSVWRMENGQWSNEEKINVYRLYIVSKNHSLLTNYQVLSSLH